MSEQVLSYFLFPALDENISENSPKQKTEKGERRQTDKTFKDWIDIYKGEQNSDSANSPQDFLQKAF